MPKQKKNSPTTDNLPYTKRLKKEKEELAFWKRLGVTHPDEILTHYNHIDFRESGITDEELHLFVTKVRSVNMFDLNGTEITCDGIEALTKLENLSELRLKECHHIDNKCIPYLNKITTLKFLYVKGTPITIDGLLGLGNLVHLEDLFFSDTAVEDMDNKLKTLATLLPQCRLIMDGKELPRNGEENIFPY